MSVPAAVFMLTCLCAGGYITVRYLRGGPLAAARVRRCLAGDLDTFTSAPISLALLRPMVLAALAAAQIPVRYHHGSLCAYGYAPADNLTGGTHLLFELQITYYAHAENMPAPESVSVDTGACMRVAFVWSGLTPTLRRDADAAGIYLIDGRRLCSAYPAASHAAASASLGMLRSSDLLKTARNAGRVSRPA